VQPTSGETVWYLSNGIDKPFFEQLLASFARTVGAGRERMIILVLDGAGWHTEPGLAVPDGLRLVYLPPYTPELQPAEHLWPLVDEPIVNRYFPTIDDLDAVLDQRCQRLSQDRQLIAAHANFHWWPKPVARN
jgi:transposase